MKKIVWVSMIFLLCIFIAACSSEEEIEDEPNVNMYEKLYDGKAKEKYDLVVGPSRYIASQGYIKNTEQGYNQWYYYAVDQNEFVPMIYQDHAFRYGDIKMQDGVISIHGSHKSSRRFVAPLTANNVLISGTIRFDKTNNDATDVSLKIYKNQDLIYPVNSDLIVYKNDLIGKYFSFNTNLTKDDVIDFVVEGKGDIFFNPIVDYTNQSLDTLYKVPEWGYYGDIHTYYHNDVVNLFHLRNHPNNYWEWYLWQTTDMFRYKEASVYTTDFVKNHYMAYERAGDLNDYKNYPAGARDGTLFYDEEIDRYRFITLAYKRNDHEIITDLTMRISSDAQGLIWTEPAIPLREFPTKAHGEPEVAAFRKIGNRWYLYASISGQSVHGVGKFSYWIGDEGKTIDQMDWKTLPTHTLDGEDLAAAQIEFLGDKMYLYGWMPRVYNAGYWGGFMNLPREVFQRDNGLLGTRLDVMAKQLLNKGLINSFTKENTIIISGSATFDNEMINLMGQNNLVQVDGLFDSTFVTYKVDMKQSNQVGFILKDGSNTYRIILMKDGNKVFLRIESPNDPSHTLNSYVIYEDPKDGIYDIQIIIEGSIIEFYVNDEIALSGRTRMGRTYEAFIYSDKEAAFYDVDIHRLAQYYDIYE